MASNKRNLKENKNQIKSKDKSGKKAQKYPPEVFYKKVALINIAKFTEKHLSQSQAEAWNFDKTETLA